MTVSSRWVYNFLTVITFLESHASIIGACRDLSIVDNLATVSSENNKSGHVMPDQQLMRTVLELDLAAYADVARVLEENLDVWAVKAFEDQIQSFVDHADRSGHEH